MADAVTEALQLIHAPGTLARKDALQNGIL
jgi:hypothetical protein